MCLAIPGRIIEIIAGDGLERRARILVGGIEREVSLGMVGDVAVGDHIVSHSGFAVRVVRDSEQGVRSKQSAVGESTGTRFHPTPGPSQREG